MNALMDSIDVTRTKHGTTLTLSRVLSPAPG